MEIEKQKQKQLELLEKIAQQKLRLETDCFRVQLEEAKRKNTQQTGVGCGKSHLYIDHRGIKKICIILAPGKLKCLSNSYLVIFFFLTMYKYK